MRIKDLRLITSMEELASLPQGKTVIDTINTYSYVRARKDKEFESALLGCDALIPDGIGIVWGSRFVGNKRPPKMRITGWDLFEFEMKRLESHGGKCFFMGSSEKTLALLREKAAEIYPNVEVITYSPPYAEHFEGADNDAIIEAINQAKPSLLWIGMSAPKQEKWLAENIARLNVDCHIGCIGAVFSFFAGTEKRAPLRWQNAGLEWLYRFVHDPRRLWKRYVNGNIRFACYLIGEKFCSKKH